MGFVADVSKLPKKQRELFAEADRIAAAKKKARAEARRQPQAQPKGKTREETKKLRKEATATTVSQAAQAAEEKIRPKPTVTAPAPTIKIGEIQQKRAAPGEPEGLSTLQEIKKITGLARNIALGALAFTIAGTALGFAGLGVTAAGRIGAVGSLGQARLLVAGAGVTSLRYASNTVTQKASLSLIQKAAIGFKNPVIIAGAIGTLIGTYPWAEWSHTEAGEIMGFTASVVRKSGDVELMRQFKKDQDEVFALSIWQQLGRLIPGVNIAVGFARKTAAIMIQKKVNDFTIDDEINKIENNMTDDDIWDQRREEQTAVEKDRTDYWNSQRKLMVEWERQAEVEGRDEDAAFWRREREKTAKSEEEEREEIADFWLQYQKDKAQFTS